jgi:hypothetical protein
MLARENARLVKNLKDAKLRIADAWHGRHRLPPLPRSRQGRRAHARDLPMG